MMVDLSSFLESSLYSHKCVSRLVFLCPEYAKVFAAYKASQFDELNINPGDIVTELQVFSKGWLRGCLRGQRGVFPSNFARVSLFYRDTNASTNAFD